MAFKIIFVLICFRNIVDCNKIDNGTPIIPVSFPILEKNLVVGRQRKTFRQFWKIAFQIFGIMLE